MEEGVEAAFGAQPDVVSQRVRRAARGSGTLRLVTSRRVPRLHGDERERALDVRRLGRHRRGKALGERREGHAAAPARRELVYHLAAAPSLERLTREPGAVAGQGDQQPRGGARARQSADGQRRRVRIRAGAWTLVVGEVHLADVHRHWAIRSVVVCRLTNDDIVCLGRNRRRLDGLTNAIVRERKRKRRGVFARGRDGARRAHRQDEPHDVQRLCFV